MANTVQQSSFIANTNYHNVYAEVVRVCVRVRGVRLLILFTLNTFNPAAVASLQ